MLGDDRTLPDEGGGLLVHAERKRFAEMRSRFAAIGQRLVRIADIVMASGVHLVRSNRFREHLHCGPVIARCLRHQPEKIQALHMCGLARENLTADFLRLVDAAHPTRTACRSGEVANAGARRAEGKRVWPPCGLVASLIGRTSFFSVHVPSTGPSCKTPPNSTPKKAAVRGLRINQPRSADIGPIALTAKNNLP